MVPFPRAASAKTARGRFLPSRRSLLLGLALLAVGGTAYGLARQTSAFAIAHVEVTGAPPDVRAQVEHALAPLLGESLVGVDGSWVERRAESLPTVVSARYDRAFPHTLRVAVVPERIAAMLRRGKESWLVSARGRVVGRAERRAESALPRIWVPTRTEFAAGEILPDADGGAAARALARADRFPAAIRSASFAHDVLVFRLRSGLELRLGAPTDVRLKLAVARRALSMLPAGTAYLDVAAPGRPVAGDNPQVSGGG